jgi:hypothetical protein
VPLGIEFCDVPVEVPGAPEVEPLEPVLLPELPDEPPLEPPPPPPCPSASETGVSRIAVTNTSVFDRMIFLLLTVTHPVVTRSVESTIGVCCGHKAREEAGQATGTGLFTSRSLERDLRLENRKNPRPLANPAKQQSRD